MPSDYTPTVSLVVPAWNAEKLIADTLQAVRALDYPKDRLQPLFVDNASTDATSRLIREAGFEPIHCERPGAAAARNAGLAEANGEIVAFTDADAVPERDWLRRLVAAFQDPVVAGAGGRIEPFRMQTGPEVHAAVCGMLNQHKLMSGSPMLPPFPATANAAYRREALLAVEGFDESLRVGEDADLGWRVQWNGGRLVYVHEAVVRHKFRAARGAYFRQTFSYGAATVDLFAKHRERFGRRAWIDGLHHWRTLCALGRAVAVLFSGRRGWERAAPFYDAACCLLWTAGRVRRSVRRRVVVC